MSLIQLNNLQNELTGLVESRFNSSMSLSSQQSVTGAKTFTGGFRGANTTITSTQTLTSSVFGGRVFISAGITQITLTMPAPVAGAMFLLQFAVGSTADLALSAGPSGTTVKFRGASGSGAASQNIRRTYGASWIFHSDGTDWFLSCIPNVNSTGQVVATIVAPSGTQTGAGIGSPEDGDIEQTVPYITSEDLEAYILLQAFLTTSSASSTYQTKSDMDYFLTKSQANTDFLRIENLPAFVTPATFSATLEAYMTSGQIASTYQTMTGMSDYLTTASASSTYQSIAGMDNYLLKTAANNYFLMKDDALVTYQQIGGMTDYLTTASAASTYAPLGSPTFTGTLTSPTINATSAIQLNGVNLDALYAPQPALGSSYLLDTEAQSLYASKASVNAKAPINNPTFTGTVSGIDKSMVGLGDVDNTSDLSKPISTATQTALNLKSNSNNPTFTGTLTAPTINATTALQIGGVSSDTLYQQRAYVMAVIPVGTTGQVVSGVTWNGAATTFTVTKTGTGAYRFDWTPAIPSTYVFMGNLRNAAGFVSFNGAGSAALNCQTYSFSGSTVTQADISSGFHVILFRNP